MRRFLQLSWIMLLTLFATSITHAQNESGETPQPEMVKVTFKAEPADLAKSLQVKYNTSGFKYKVLPEDGMIEPGKTIRAYIEPKEGIVLKKFTVNGKDYEGKTMGSETKPYIQITVNENTDIVAVLEKPKPGEGSVKYLMQGGDETCKVQGYLATMNEDGTFTPDKSQPFESEKVLPENQTFVIEATPGSNFIIKNWTYEGSIMQNPDESIFTETQLPGMIIKNLNPEIIVTFEKKPQPEMVKVTFKAEPADLAKSLQVKYNTSGFKYKVLPEDGMIEPGKTIRAYIEPKEGIVLKKFTVNGKDYEGKTMGSETKPYIQITVNENTDIVAVLEKPKPGEGSVKYLMQGGDETCKVQGYLATMNEDGTFTPDKSQPFESEKVLPENQTFVIEATPGSNFIIKNWTYEGSIMQNPDESIFTETQLPGMIIKNLNPEIIVTFEKKPQPEMVKVTLKAEPADLAKSLQVKYKSQDDEEFSATNEEGLVIKDATVRASVELQANATLIKFVVNEEDFTGDIHELNGLKYIEIKADKALEIKAILKKTLPTFTFDIKGDNATKANATITVMKQKKNDKGKWTDESEVKSGDEIEPDQHLSIKAKYDNGFIIKNWLNNGEVVMHTSKQGDTFVSTFNPLFFDMTDEDTKIEIELDIPNITWVMNLPQGLSKADKKQFAITVKDGENKIFGQKMEGFKYGYYMDNLEGKKITLEAQLPEGYQPNWSINSKEIDDHKPTITIDADKQLDIALSFASTEGIESIEHLTKIYTTTNKIAIETNTNEQYAIYSLDGRLIQKGITTEETTMVEAEAGKYMVVLQGNTQKVVVR